MKKNAKLPRPASSALEKNEPSRRKFLQSAAVAGVAVVTMPISGIAQAGQQKNQSGPGSPIEEILKRYGSELGHVNEIG